MNIFKIGQQRIVFEGAGEGAGGGGTGEAAHPVAPWGEAGDAWSVGEGESAAAWTSFIPEDAARAHVEAKGYKNPAELALANYSLTQLQRGDPTVIGMPGEGATPEQMGEFYGKLGRPDAPEGYEFKFADDVKVDEGMLTFGRGAFHEAGLSPAQAQIVADKWNEFAATQNGDMATQMTEQNDAKMTALQERWGADLDKNKAAGQRAVQALGLDATLVAEIEQGIGSAAIVELMAAIGRKSDEGGFTGGQQGGDPNDSSNMTKEQAGARITHLQGDKEFQAKYTDAKHPEHAAAVKVMMDLFAKA